MSARFGLEVRRAAGTRFLSCALAACAFLAVLCGFRPVSAHPMSFGSARVVVEDTALEAELVLDVPSDVLEKPRPERKRELVEQVEQGFGVWFGEARCRPGVSVLDLGVGESAVDVVRARCDRPKEMYAVRFSTSEQLGDVAVELVVSGRTGERALVAAGETSRLLSLQAVSAEPAGAASTANPERASSPSSAAAPTASAIASRSNAAPSSASSVPLAAPPSMWTRLVEYLRLGFFHILPEGIDHELFLLTLVLLVPRWQSLVLLLTVFTCGHALSLALGVYGAVRLDGAWVEPLIAASLGYAALEKERPELEPFRALVVFAFGLIHGLGFAGALAEARVPEDERVLALVGFNTGVELGQLAAAALPFVVVQLLRRREQLEPSATWALRAVAALGLCWAALRIVG